MTMLGIRAYAFCAFIMAVGLTANAAAAQSVDPVVRGKQVYSRCVACHSPARNRTGPKHCGVVGRRAGAVDNFAYSIAMTRSGIVWTTDTLDMFLEAPRKFMPGTSMGYAGIPDPADRRALIAYLESLSLASDACR